MCFLFVTVSSAQMTVPRSSYPLPTDVDYPLYVRVALLQGATKATVTLSGQIEVRTIETGERIDTFFAQGAYTLIPMGSGIRIGDERFPLYGVRLVSEEQSFILNGKQYHNDIVIIRERDMTLTCINYVDLEYYLKGVLPQEILPQWPYETLKAQAVASRTFALFSEIAHKKNDYSLVDTVYSQMYGGKHAQHETTDRAIDDTRNMVLIFRNEIFPAYFHAVCGGYTTKPENVWKTAPHPVLRGVLCSYCKNARFYSWTFEIGEDVLQKKLAAKGIHTGVIYAIAADAYDESGRVVNFIIQSEVGKLAVGSNTFRLALGPENLKSTKITRMAYEEGQFVFDGLGWGHGVGLCQWGAKGMGDVGFSMDEILTYYFPGAQIAVLNTVEKNIFDEREQV